MRRSCFILLTLFFLSAFAKRNYFAGTTSSYSINDYKIATGDSDELLICIIPLEPQIDQEVWQKYLQDNLVLDSAALDTILPGTYTAMIRFVVDRQGRISNVSIQKDPGYGLGEKARNIIAQYKGLWQPAMQSGLTVKAYKVQPITFVIEDDEEVDEQVTDSCFSGKIIPDEELTQADSLVKQDEIIACDLPSYISPCIDLKRLKYYMEDNIAFDSLIDIVPVGSYATSVQFVIDKDGTMNNFSILNDPGFGLGERIKQIISQYKKRWNPAIKNGHIISCYWKQSITINITKDENGRAKMVILLASR